MKGHEVEGVQLPRPADVPLDERGRALEGDAVADAVGLRLQLPLDDLVDGLHPLPHRLAWGEGADGGERLVRLVAVPVEKVLG